MELRLLIVTAFYFLISHLTIGKQIFDEGNDQAEAVLEKALGEMRSQLVGAKEGRGQDGLLANPSLPHPAPPIAPPRAFAEQILNFTLSPALAKSSPLVQMLPPVTVLINPARIEIPPPRARNPVLANFVVRPNEPKHLVHKFEFMPHFDKEKYEFMVPEGSPIQSDSLVAVLTFYGHLDGELPQFGIKFDRLDWFSIGKIITTQETNYVLTEVPILRRAVSNINWTDTDDGIYRFQVQSAQGQMKSMAQIEVEVLPTRNYTHLEMEPTMAGAEEERTLGGDKMDDGTEEHVGQSDGKRGNEREQNGKQMEGGTNRAHEEWWDAKGEGQIDGRGKPEEEEKQQRERVEGRDFTEKEMELLQMDPLGVDLVEPAEGNNATAIEGEEGGEEQMDVVDMPVEMNAEEEDEKVRDMLFGGDKLEEDEEKEDQEGDEANDGGTVAIPAGRHNLTLRVQLEGRPASNGRIRLDFAELAPLLHIPMPNLMTELIATGSENDNSANSRLVRLEVRPTSGELDGDDGLLDIRPHFLAPGDRAHLWIADPMKVAKLVEKSGSAGWAQQFKLFAHLVDDRGQSIADSPPALIVFSGHLSVRGGPLAAPRFVEYPLGGYEFAISETANHGQVLGRVGMAKAEEEAGKLAVSLFGQGAELFRIGEDGTLRLNCHRKNVTSSEMVNATTANRCLDRDHGPPVFYLVASAYLADAVGPNSLPVPITIRVEDANDNGPRLELFPHPAAKMPMLAILDGQIVGGPLVLAIRDEDSSSENRANRLWLDGNCSRLFAIVQLNTAAVANSWPLFAIDIIPNGQQLMEESEECGHLELIASDQDGHEDRRHILVTVNATQNRLRFGSQVYERTMGADKIHTGIPIVQMQLVGPSRKTVPNFVIVEGNPGWLAIEPFTGNVFVNEVPKGGIPPEKISLRIVAFDRENHFQLAESMLRLDVIGTSAPVHIHFPSPLIQKEVDRLEEEEERGRAQILLPIFGDAELAEHVKLDGIEAWNDAGQPVELAKDGLLYSPRNGSIRLNLLPLHFIRSIHAHFTLKVELDEEHALLALTFRSDPAKLEQRRRRLSRPRFVAPWTDENVTIRINIAEELPIGRSFLRLPAFNPTTGAPVQVQLEGPNADFFILNNKTGELKIGRRLDFERSSRFQQISLIADSPEADRPVRAQIQIELLDVDDVEPEIRIHPMDDGAEEGEEERRQPTTIISNNPQNGRMAIVGLKMEENAPAGKQLAIVEVDDPDSQKHRCELVGKDAHKFTLQPRAAATNKQKHSFSTSTKRQWILATAAGDVDLDREQVAQLGLVLHCVDWPGQNRADQALVISLIDQNDNRPVISWAHQTQLAIALPARDWPHQQGTAAVISRFWARDRDEAENGRVQFQLGQSGLANNFFRIDSENGQLTAADDRPLANLAEMLAGEPLELEVMARDNGHPPLVSSVKVRILLEEGDGEGQRELRLLWPNIDEALVEVDEDAPLGRKMGKAEAIWMGKRMGMRRGGEGGGGEEDGVKEEEIHFRISDGNEEEGGEAAGKRPPMLRIDPRSGEIFTDAKFDFERQRQWTFLVTAFSPSSGQQATGLLAVKVRNVDEHLPHFLHNLESSPVKPFFHWPISSPPSNGAPLRLGRVEAVDADGPPFDRVLYSIVQKCSHPAQLFAPDGPPLIQLDQQTGEIRANTGFPQWANISAVQLCILASSSLGPASAGAKLPPSPDSLPTHSLLRLQLLPPPALPSSTTLLSANNLLLINNSHSLLEHRLALQRIPLRAQMPSGDGHQMATDTKNDALSLHSILYTPYGQSAVDAHKIGSLEPMRTLLAIGPHDGQLRFDPAAIGALGEGFYQFGLALPADGQKTNREEGRPTLPILYRNVHFVEDKWRLRLLFNKSMDAVGAKLGRFIREFEELLSASRKSADSNGIRVIHSEMTRDRDRPMLRTSMCFHLWSPADAILAFNQTIRLVSTNGPKPSKEQLADFYAQNAVINVEPCLDPVTTNRGQSRPGIWMSARSKEWLFWSVIAGIFILAFFALGGYFCFVRSYREYLRRKSGDLLPAADEQSDSSPFHQYLVNQCSSVSVFSVPEFIQAKAITMNSENCRRK